MVVKIVSIVKIGQYMFMLSTTLKFLKMVTYSVIIFVKKNYWNDQLCSVFIVFGLILYCLGSRETAILAVSGGGSLCCGASAFYTSPSGVSTAHALSQRTPDLVAQRLSQPLSPRALVPLPLDPHSPITYLLSPRDVLSSPMAPPLSLKMFISLLYPCLTLQPTSPSWSASFSYSLNHSSSTPIIFSKKNKNNVGEGGLLKLRHCALNSTTFR